MSKHDAKDAVAPKAPASEPKATEPKSQFHVRGPGSVHMGGENHPAGASLELTASEAKSMADSVAPGPAPKKRAPSSEAGIYKIVGPGSICHQGKFLGPDELIELSSAEAKAFSDRVEPAA